MRRRVAAKLLRLFVVFFAVAGLAGTRAAWGQAGSNWDRVKAVDPGTPIRLQGESGRRVFCDVLQVDDTQLICSRSRRILFFPMSDRMVYQRKQVREVRLTRRLLSSVVGAGIGVGAGVGVGYGLENQATRAEDPGLLQFTFGLLGGLVGEAVGQGTDFLGGPVIYRAP